MCFLKEEVPEEQDTTLNRLRRLGVSKWSRLLNLEMLNLFPETSTLDQVTPREGRDCNLCSQPPCLEAGLGTLTGAGVEAGWRMHQWCRLTVPFPQPSVPWVRPIFWVRVSNLLVVSETKHSSKCIIFCLRKTVFVS